MITFSPALNALLVGAPSARASILKTQLANSTITVRSGGSVICTATSVAPAIADQLSERKWAQYTVVRWVVTPSQTFTASAGDVVIRIAAASDATKYLEASISRVGVDGFADAPITVGDTAALDVAVRFVETEEKYFWFGPSDNVGMPGVNANSFTFGLPVVLDVAPNTQITSDEFVALGLDYSQVKEIQVTGTGAGININNAGWLAAGVFHPINEGDKFRVRFTTGAGPNDASALNGQSSGLAFYSRTASGQINYGQGGWGAFYDNRRAGNAVQTFQVGPTRTYTQVNQCRDLLRAGDTVEIDYNGGIPYEQFEIRRCGHATMPITIRSATPYPQRAVIGVTTSDINVGDPDYPVYRLVFLRGNHIIVENLEITAASGHHVANERHSIVTVNVVASGGTTTPVVPITQGGTTQTITVPANSAISLKAIHSATSAPVRTAVLKWVGAAGGVFPGAAPYTATRADGFVETYDASLPPKTAFTSGSVGMYTLRVGLVNQNRVQCLVPTCANTIVRDCYMHDAGGGVLQTEFGTGSIEIYRNKMIRLGDWQTTEPYSHNCYVNFDNYSYPDHKLKFWGNFVYDFGGNGLASRSKQNEVYSNWIEAGTEIYPPIGNTPYIAPLNSRSGYPLFFGGHDEFSQDQTGTTSNLIYSNVIIATHGFAFVTGGDSVSHTWGKNWIAYNSFLYDAAKFYVGTNPQNMGLTSLARFRRQITSCYYANNVVGFVGGLADPMPKAFASDTDPVPYGWSTKPFVVVANNHLPVTPGFTAEVQGPTDPLYQTRKNLSGNVIHGGNIFTNQTFANPNLTPLTTIPSHTGQAPEICVPNGLSNTVISSPTARCWPTRPALDGSPLPPIPTGAPKTTAGAI
jgi:hypothetical protein